MTTINDTIELKSRTSEPSNPEEGEIYYDSNDKKLKVYNGSEWV